MTGSVESSVCKRCKKSIKTAVKCTNCGNQFHTSCAKLCNVKIVDDVTIVCCEKVTDSDCDAAFFDAIEEISGTEKKVDVHIFNYIIRQKDIIISELNEKVKLLNNQIELMNKYQQNSDQEQAKNSDNIGTKTEAATKNTAGNIHKIKPSDNSKMNNVGTQFVKKSPITSKDLSAGLLEVENKMKLDKYINLTKNNDTPSTSSSKEGEWQQVAKRRKKRSVIIGSNRDSIIQGVPKYVVLHVYRVDPKINAAELTEHLKPHLPEISCEALIPKYPGVYSSYKVSIYESNFKKAMDSSIWPLGVCISRFLQMGNKRKEPKD